MSTVKFISSSKVSFTKLTRPSLEIVATLNKWENDPALTALIHPNRNKVELERNNPVTVEILKERLEHSQIYLIYADSELVGEMNFQIDPRHLFKREIGSVWIGINIGEASARGKGIGTQAMRYLEEVIRVQGFRRIELGVFEFNKRAIKLYKKMGYQEIGRIDAFTYWNEKMWQDIRMEKRLK